MYPMLIDKHVIKVFQQVDSEKLRLDFETNRARMSFGNLSMLIMSTQGALEDINEVESRQISRIVDAYAVSEE